MRTLIFGYGNPDRQDDGVAWHVMVYLKKLFAYPTPEEIEDDFGSAENPAFVFQLQLTPEIAEDLALYDRVCFLDAHTGAVPEVIHKRDLLPLFTHSPLTHHLTPDSLLAIMESIFGKTPESILVSVRGYSFQFTHSLSEAASLLVPQAAELIYNWIINQR